MEQVWVFDTLAVAVRRVDFLDPALAGQSDARERGVRLEVRPVRTRTDGSVYASDELVLEPALCRVDLLESGPGRADRMHWHPSMSDGEPGERTFDVDMPADPQGWLQEFLRSGLDGALAQADEARDEIGRAVDAGLAWARAPWPEVDHDERGMATPRREDPDGAGRHAPPKGWSTT